MAYKKKNDIFFPSLYTKMKNKKNKKKNMPNIYEQSLEVIIINSKLLPIFQQVFY